jgi:hypothetical protein
MRLQACGDPVCRGATAPMCRVWGCALLEFGNSTVELPNSSSAHPNSSSAHPAICRRQPVELWVVFYISLDGGNLLGAETGGVSAGIYV